jgi:serine/threonine protein kinase
MLSHIANSEDMVKSFVREARLASYLHHQNVAETYDLGKVGNTYFIVMELITGRNLREVLRHCGATTGPMPVPVALNILNQICDALDYAHNLCDETGQPLGIIHRDVSPSNIIVSDGGVVKLIDFGIAKASGGGMQTMSGTLKGKFAYMAPEYIAGRIDARADLFAVGVIAHELLTNRPLFSGRDDIDTLTRVRDMHIDPPSKKNPQVPPEIDDIVMTALARDPERRWQHATALRTALTTLTRRLGLIASNVQAIQWLDWAFAHQAAPRKRPDNDTETDAAPLAEEPSISIEQRTSERAAMSGKITLVMRGDAPDVPTQTPVGTPAYIPAQHPPLTACSVPVPVPVAAERSGPAGTPRVTANASVPPMARTSSAYPARAPSVAGLPIAQPSPRPASPSPAMTGQPAPYLPVPQPPSPPMAGHAYPPSPATSSQPGGAMPLAPYPPAPGSYPAPPMPSLNPAPFGAPRPARSSQAPGMPGTPPVTGSPAPAYDPARRGAQHEVTQRTSTPANFSAPGPRRGHLVTVVLVVFAAAAAAAAVYFGLPLLT